MNFRMIAALLILVVAIVAWGNPPQNSAIIGVNQPLTTQTSLSGCTWPAGAPTTTSLTAICPVLVNGVAVLATSYQGGSFVLPSAPAAGVTSFNGRTGAVTLTEADVANSGLKVATTVTTTSTSTAVSTPQ